MEQYENAIAHKYLSMLLLDLIFFFWFVFIAAVLCVAYAVYSIYKCWMRKWLYFVYGRRHGFTPLQFGTKKIAQNLCLSSKNAYLGHYQNLCSMGRPLRRHWRESTVNTLINWFHGFGKHFGNDLKMDFWARNTDFARFFSFGNLKRVRSLFPA